MSFSWATPSNGNNNSSNNASGGGGGGGGFGGWGTNTNANNNNPNNNNNANSTPFTNQSSNSAWSTPVASSNSWGSNVTSTPAPGANTNKNANPWSFSNTSSGGNSAQQQTPFGFNNNASNAPSNAGSNTTVNPNSDHIISNPPSDSISAVQFHPGREHFIVSSWDASVSYHEYFGNNQSKPLSQFKSPSSKPILSCCFDSTGDTVLAAGCDNAITLWNPQANDSTPLSNQSNSHSASVRSILYNSAMNVAVSGSWDRTVALWDIRTKSRAHSMNVGHKVYAMATKGQWLVVATSDHDIKSYDLRNNAREVHSIAKEASSNSKAVSLKKQVRCVDIFSDGKGYVSASVGGRVIIKHLDRNSPTEVKKDFSYKCHRQQSERDRSNHHVFAINCVRFHQQSGVFATGGDDGEIVTWDKDARAKLATFKAMQMSSYRNNSGNNTAHVDNSRMPIVAMDYDRSGRYLLYATSYNWNKGAAFHDATQQKPQVYLHQVDNKEVNKKK